MTKADVEAEIRNITAQIINKYQPEKIILFGSAATGNLRSDSDIDILIIKKTPRKKFHHRIGDVLNILDYEMPVEPLVYTPQELKKRISLGDFFIEEVLTTGKVLYDKTQH